LLLAGSTQHTRTSKEDIPSLKKSSGQIGGAI